MTTFAVLARSVVLLASFTSGLMMSNPGERPEGPPPPPPEAISACEGLQVGDACGFTGRRGETVEGSCFTPAADKPLACRPDQPPPPPPRD